MALDYRILIPSSLACVGYDPGVQSPHMIYAAI